MGSSTTNETRNTKSPLSLSNREDISSRQHIGQCSNTWRTVFWESVATTTKGIAWYPKLQPGSFQQCCLQCRHHNPLQQSQMEVIIRDMADRYVLPLITFKMVWIQDNDVIFDEMISCSSHHHHHDNGQGTKDSGID